MPITSIIVSQSHTPARKRGRRISEVVADNISDSVFWMAPEILEQNGAKCSSKSDIWSLGCVYLEMVTGRRPWPDDNYAAVVFKVTTAKEAPPFPDSDSGVPSEGRSFLNLCFER